MKALLIALLDCNRSAILGSRHDLELQMADLYIKGEQLFQRATHRSLVYCLCITTQKKDPRETPETFGVNCVLSIAQKTALERQEEGADTVSPSSHHTARPCLTRVTYTATSTSSGCFLGFAWRVREQQSRSVPSTALCRPVFASMRAEDVRDFMCSLIDHWYKNLRSRYRIMRG